jgi:hypothetical protein
LYRRFVKLPRRVWCYFSRHCSSEWKLSSRLERVLGVGAKYSETGEAVRGGLRELNGQEWYRQLCAELLRRFRENAFGIPDVELLRKITSY